MKLPTTIILAMVVVISNSELLAMKIPFSDISYVYPLDYGPVGPNQGDSGQPRSDITFYGDSGGNTLSNGIVPTSWPNLSDPDIYVVGFNEYHGAGAGTDTGTPQPRIDFDLGGSRDLTRVAINYFTGGNSAIVGPESVEISFSTDGGVNYSNLPDVVYTGFDTTNDPGSTTLYQTTDTIPLGGSGITNVRMDFFQGNDIHTPTTSAWVFLGEITFDEVPEPSSFLLCCLGLVGLTGVSRCRRR